ncbi:unnamed protein product [Didymodactylos carnosus]|uniref:BZIP domain-containing protein n=1 Tax=Didymodactylos carnosus TaxID=1234261 RepID=A0A813RMM4_9BILA|nr:unnamed protein product [Didymodactylos carnosus]CAF3566505.1 unnamed protein product [Didymodactylos carnosus]
MFPHYTNLNTSYDSLHSQNEFSRIASFIDYSFLNQQSLINSSFSPKQDCKWLREQSSFGITNDFAAKLNVSLISQQHLQSMNDLYNDENVAPYEDTHDGTLSAVLPSTPTATTHRKKRSRPYPEEKKDDDYREKRRKNNLSAKHSRSVRRSKEKYILTQATFLETENSQLKAEHVYLRSELRRVKCLYRID